VEGYEDLYTRIYVDSSWPEMDYWLWKIGSSGGGWVGGGMPEPGDPGTDPEPLRFRSSQTKNRRAGFAAA